MSQIVGILLAAGSSRRFGADKRLHPLHDGTQMALASARHLAAVCARTIVVIRPDDTALASLLATEGLETVVCAEAAQGMGHSLACGVAATADAAGWLVALADMPYIPPASYHVVLQSMRDGAALARPIHDGSPGHPVAFGAAHLDKLLALTGDQGGKAILEANPAAVVLCSVDDPGVLKDVDVPVQIEAPGSPVGALSA
jgi:molybdenum cofactor cytidylyltransferase